MDKPLPLFNAPEAKWNDTIGLAHLRRLEHVRDLLRARSGVHAANTRLFLFGGAGFTDDLQVIAAQDANLQLIHLDRLYHGS